MVFKNRFKRTKLVDAFVVTSLGSGTSKLLLVLTTFVSTNMLTKAEFGELSFLRNTLNMILCICALNFESLCTKFATECSVSDKAYQKLFWLIFFSFVACLSFGIILMLIPNGLLIKLFLSKTILFYFKVSAILLPIFMLQPIIEGILKGLQKFKEISYIQVGTSFFYLLVIFIGISVGGLVGAFFSVMIYYSAYSIVCLLILLRNVSFKSVISKLPGLKKQYSVVPNLILPVFLMSFIEAPAMWFAQVILSHYSSVESIASMTAIMQIRNLATLVPSYFIGTFIAFACELNAKRDYDGYFRKFDKIEKYYISIGFAFFLVLSLFSKVILRLYGEDYVGDYVASAISNVGIPLIMLLSLYRINMVVQEHQKHLLNISIIWNLLWLLFLYIFIKLKITPLSSFFISYNLANIAGLVYMYLYYKKDKIRLMSYNED